MRKLTRYLKPYGWNILLICVLVFITAMTDLQLPDYMSQIVNEGVVLGETGVILQVGLKMLGVALIGAIASICIGFLASRTGAGLARDLRHGVFSKVEGFSLTEFDKFSTASLITRTTNDIQQVQMVVIMLLRMVLQAPIMAIGGITKAVSKNPSMSWIIAAAVACMFVLIFLLFNIAMPRFKKLQKLVDRLNLVTRESLVGLRVIRAFNTQAYEEEKFKRANSDLTKTNLFVNRLMVMMQPIMMLLLNITTIGIIWIGSHYVGDGIFAVGDMMAFMQYSMQIMFAFLMVSIIFIMIPRASVSANRIVEVLESQTAINDPDRPKTAVQEERGKVEFRHVSFRYPGAEEPVLHDIDFVAYPGQTTALIGSTGSGKSTLVNLIPRFYDVSEGELLVDGVSVKELRQHDLREKIGYVPQKGVLFTGDIASNILYGNPDADQQTMEEAASIAQATEFIQQTEKGYQTEISQGGTNVSGGQKQRLSIARALAKRPEILIFDDSFSALDFKTDAALRRALQQQTQGITTLIVAQRISTIVHADQIIVLDEGRIMGKGTHEQLLQSCDVYREIAYSQLSEEELA